MLAAWIIGGNGAGGKALFSRENGIYIPAACDGPFPAEVMRGIRNLPAGREGIAEAGDARVFLEFLPDGRKLVVCGGGHVALCVVRLGAMLGYETTVIEDREEYAEKARKAGAQRIICKPFGEALDMIEGDCATAFVIMTREHAHDMDCLRRILGKACAYAGMMGSRSRTEQVRQQLLDEGYDAGKVARLHMPIGLAIGSRTPGEIAVSVAAELISVLNAADPGEGFPPGMAEELAQAERAGKTAGVLAMIVEKNGEAPRRPGTKMLVRSDGSILGTVGGGYAEAMILQAAGQIIREGSRESRLVRIGMQKGTMHCGGEITVCLLPLGGNAGENEGEG